MALVVVGGFEWDSTKAAANIASHGVTFQEAATVLGDDAAVEPADLTHPERVVTIGFSIRARLLLVVSTERGDRIRISSARKATKDEQAEYASGG